MSKITPQLKAWFGNSKVVDSQGKPLRVYHGSTHIFNKFSKRKSYVDNDWGKGFYFTNNPEDASSNYAGIGPDLENRIGDLADRLVSDTVSLDQAYKIATKRIKGEHDGAVMPCYLRMERPFVYGKNGPYWDYEYDERTGKETGELALFLKSFRRSLKGYFDVDLERIASDLYDEELDEGGHSYHVIKKFRGSEGLIYATDKNGTMAVYEILRKTLEYMGYDGIIDSTVQRFRMEGVDSTTSHYIVFNPNQIKSATGNKGEYSRERAEIGESVAKNILRLIEELGEISLEHRSPGTPPSNELVTSMLNKYMEEEWKDDLPHLINNGNCDEWAYGAARSIPGSEVWATTENYTKGAHVFLKVGNLFYDAECLKGESNWYDLPFFWSYT